MIARFPTEILPIVGAVAAGILILMGWAGSKTGLMTAGYVVIGISVLGGGYTLLGSGSGRTKTRTASRK